MDVLVTDNSDSVSSSQLVTEFDFTPIFWNYLVGLDSKDLIAELVQNDLDQGATRTTILFESSYLVCEGNGEPIGQKGWQRLQKIMGAGNEVSAKRESIGIKNHGLKTAFTIGDEIHLKSDGKSIIQTLYKNGRDQPPYPGASAHPVEDSEAPTKGCRIVIKYRDSNLEVVQGEKIGFGAVDLESIGELFKSACASAPEQFAGIVSPEITPHYDIILKHWKLGEARFSFSCTRPRKITKRIEVFKRQCIVSGTCSTLPGPLREQAIRRLIAIEGLSRDRIASFFRRRRRFFVEASWSIDARGKPKTGIGRYRYPLGYPLNSLKAQTGISTNFNAPFISDNIRHAPAQNDSSNTELQAACNELLIDALKYSVIPQWRADGLNLLVPNSDTEGGGEVARRFLAELATNGALPIIDYHQASELALKRKRIRTKLVVRKVATKKSSKKNRRYKFVIPVLTGEENGIEPILSLLCPSAEMQLDPRVNAKIVHIISCKDTPGFCKEFITFDEDDVIARIINDGNQYFGGIVDPEREFSDPFIARMYLDMIELLLKGKIDAEQEDSVISALLLPSLNGQATAFRNLYSVVSLPSDIPSLSLPPIIDNSLITHSIFKRKKWRLKRYTMAKFLESSSLESSNHQTRKKFWKWLSRNGRHVAPRTRPKLADLLIWPDKNYNLCKISDLCEPRSKQVSIVLASSIRRPHEQVLNSKLVSVGGKARISVRRSPSKNEIRNWLDAKLVQFETGNQTDIATARKLRRFEGELGILLKDRSIASKLKLIELALPALARDGTIQLRTKLVLPNRENSRIALPDRFLLNDRKNAAMLSMISPGLNSPTATMLLSAFDADPGNISAL